MTQPYPSAEQTNCNCSGDNCGCGGLDRRDLLRWMGATAAGSLLARAPVMAGPFEKADFQWIIPADKKLDPDWVKSLYERGERVVYQGDALEKIGMPVGGICAGQVYLGGDGALWLWDIFNAPIRSSGQEHYAKPPKPSSPLAQGFALRVRAGDKVITRTLNRTGFPGVTFCGEYPIGTVEYRDAAVPVAVTLEAFSPFIPLATDASSLPATVLRFTLKNTSSAPVEAELAGWLQNAVCLYTGKARDGELVNSIRREEGLTLLVCAAEPAQTEPASEARPPVVFADFEGKDYGDWKTEGEVFGKGPAQGSRGTQSTVDYRGRGLVNTVSQGGEGKLISPQFTIERPFINFLIGGGSHKGKTCLNLIVGGKAVRTAVGKNGNQMDWSTWDVKALAGKTAQLEIVDTVNGWWGHIQIDHIEFSDLPRGEIPFNQRHDYGTMTLALLDGRQGDLATAALRGASPSDAVFAGDAPKAEAKAAIAKTLIGALGRRLTLAPGAEEVVTFAVTWHFPNWTLTGLKNVGGLYYATLFKSAADVARHLNANSAALYNQTRLWRDTWYNSTLPRWFLDRVFVPASTLATNTCRRLTSGRFWAWEGVHCCLGNCTHVWQYAHSMARLFPELERNTRERSDYGVGFNPSSGVIGFRGEFDTALAVDGQAGTILRTYREHLMSPDEGFLRRNWVRIRKSFEPLLELDPERDGILEGAQHNTLDAAWFGKIAWLSSMYVAALRAGESMAREMGDERFAEACRSIAQRGAANIDRSLFYGEYYYQVVEGPQTRAVGSFDGCEIDQMMGQSWARQVGLDAMLSPANVRKALASIWKFNFTPDVGPFRQSHEQGRWYAMAGEGGTIMCSWPRGEGKRVNVSKGQGIVFWPAYYLNEVWTGQEYQVASHMMWEGMVLEALAVVRAIHDRHHPARRNPYNEIECGDHYARAMASHAVFIAACGYEYHGPKGHLGFAPRLSPEDFRAPFTAAEGWGTYSQKIEGQTMKAAIEVKWGKLRLKTLALSPPKGTLIHIITVTTGGKRLQVVHQLQDGRLLLTLPDTTVTAGQRLEISIT